MDLRRLGLFDRSPYGVDVFLHRTRQRGDSRSTDFAGDAAARFEVAGRGDREACLDHIDSQLFQLARDAQLGVGIQVKAGRLLAVAQRRVEDEYSVRRGLLVHYFSTGSNQGIIERSSRPTFSIWCSESF